MNTAPLLNERLSALILPVVHSNGTSKQELVDGYKAAFRDVAATIERFSKIEFNSRDYTYSHGAYAAARVSRNTVLGFLHDVQGYLLVHLAGFAPTFRFPSESCQLRNPGRFNAALLDLPQCGLNGTNRDSLYGDYTETRAILRRAISSVEKITFNARDYYVSGPDAYRSASLQREMAIDALKAVNSYLFTHMECLA